MVTKPAHCDALETCLEMDEAPIVHPVFQCSWCKHKYFPNVASALREVAA